MLPIGLALVPALLLPIGIAHAAVAPNPGGSVVVTNSTTSTISYIDTPVTQRVDNYSTTLLGLVNGSQVFFQTYALAFSDPVVEAAVVQADAVLAGDGASFGGPLLILNNSVLQSSIPTPPPTYTCDSVQNGLIGSPTGVDPTTMIDTFGPNTILVGECQDDSFFILAGQLDVNVNTNVDYAVPRNVVTTNTFLTTQSYEIDGSTTQTNTPEPATWALLLGGLAALGGLARRRKVNNRLR